MANQPHERELLQGLMTALQRRLSGARGSSRAGNESGGGVTIQHLAIRVDPENARKKSGPAQGDDDGDGVLSPGERVSKRRRERADVDTAQDPNAVYMQQQAVAAGFHSRFNPFGRFYESQVFQGLGQTGARIHNEIGLLQRAAAARGMTGLASFAGRANVALQSAAAVKNIVQNVLPTIGAGMKGLSKQAFGGEPADPVTKALKDAVDGLAQGMIELSEKVDQVEEWVKAEIGTLPKMKEVATRRVRLFGEKANLDVTGEDGIPETAHMESAIANHEEALRRIIEKKRKNRAVEDVIENLMNGDTR